MDGYDKEHGDRVRKRRKERRPVKARMFIDPIKIEYKASCARIGCVDSKSKLYHGSQGNTLVNSSEVNWRTRKQRTCLRVSASVCDIQFWFSSLDIAHSLTFALFPLTPSSSSHLPRLLSTKKVDPKLISTNSLFSFPIHSLRARGKQQHSALNNARKHTHRNTISTVTPARVEDTKTPQYKDRVER